MLEMATPALPAHNVSTMYYDPGFALGEDVRDESGEAQDEAWKHSAQDGRAHVSHREEPRRMLHAWQHPSATSTVSKPS